MKKKVQVKFVSALACILLTFTGVSAWASNQTNEKSVSGRWSSMNGYVLNIKNMGESKNFHIYNKPASMFKNRYNWNLNNGKDDNRSINLNAYIGGKDQQFSETLYMKYNPPFNTYTFTSPGDLVVEVDGKPVVTFKPDFMASGYGYLCVLPMAKVEYDKNLVEVNGTLVNGNFMPMSSIEITYKGESEQKGMI